MKKRIKMEFIDKQQALESQRYGRNQRYRIYEKLRLNIFR